MKKIFVFIFCLLALVELGTAIPAFARKYGYSCEVCHAPVPRLKAFGEEFMENGYRIPDKEPPRATIDTGDPLLLLQREIPLAFRFDGFLSYEPNSDVKPDIRSPFVMKILSGGNISKSISYYAYFLLAEEGKIAGLEDAYLSFKDVFGLPFSFVFGQYRVSDPISPSELRLTYEDYRLYKFRQGRSLVNLSYDRGLMGTLKTKFGVEFVLQIVNGNGIDTPEIFDKDKYKNFVWRIAQSIQKSRVRIGILGYYGKEKEDGASNRVTYFGPDIKIKLAKAEFLFQYLRRWDTNPLFLRASEKHKSEGFLGEIFILPYGEKGRLFLTLAYNQINSRFEETKYKKATLNLSYLLGRNLKWMSEYSHDLDGKDHRFLGGFVVAF